MSGFSRTGDRNGDKAPDGGSDMKALLKRIVARAIANDTVWAMFSASILKVGKYAERARKCPPGTYGRVVRSAVQNIAADLIVKHGVFKGMKYPQMKPVGSGLFPKLIGSYEKELESIWEGVCSCPCRYSEVVDIGCAEGYYAVGLAIRLPEARVFAYDTDPTALELCRSMAVLNDVGDRVFTGGFCGPDTLRHIPITGRALVVSDCEGYEQELFTKESVEHLAGHDVLVEIHDFVDIHISGDLCERFAATHEIFRIEPVSDIRKAQTYKFEELRGYDLETRRLLLAEGRPAGVAWLFMRSRSGFTNCPVAKKQALDSKKRRPHV